MSNTHNVVAISRPLDRTLTLSDVSGPSEHWRNQQSVKGLAYYVRTVFYVESACFPDWLVAYVLELPEQLRPPHAIPTLRPYWVKADQPLLSEAELVPEDVANKYFNVTVAAIEDPKRPGRFRKSEFHCTAQFCPSFRLSLRLSKVTVPGSGHGMVIAKLYVLPATVELKANTQTEKETVVRKVTLSRVGSDTHRLYLSVTTGGLSDTPLEQSLYLVPFDVAGFMKAHAISTARAKATEMLSWLSPRSASS